MNGLIKILKNKYSWAVYASLIILFVIFLFQLPLAGELGFEYSLFTALFLSFLISVFCAGYLKKQKDLLLNRKFFWLTITAFTLLPLVLGIIKGLIVFPCPLPDGFYFYLLLVIPNVAVSVSVSIIIFRLCKRFRLLYILLIHLFILLLPLVEFYKNPQVYFFNPLIGYYPGTIYDEGITIDWAVISYRLIITLFFSSAALIPAAGLIKRKGYKIVYAFALVMVSFGFYMISPMLGYSTDKGRLTETLNNKTETEHFTIYMTKNVDARLRKIIIAEHEYYYSVLKEFFHSSPAKKITSYVFDDDSQKKFLTGAGKADVAKPWLYEIYTEAGSREHTLKHEIAHCFTADFGSTVFKIAGNFNPALVEGIAVAAEGTFNNYPLDTVVVNAYKSDRKIKINKLFSSFSFFANASSLSYAYAGSFVKYLIDKYGIEKFKLLYKTGNFNDAYKIELTALVKNYLSVLSSAVTSVNKNEADYYFGGKSIFSKVCPRFVATQTDIGWEYYNNSDYVNSLRVFANLRNLSPTYSALIGETSSLLKLKRWREAENILAEKISGFSNTAYYFNLELKYADFLFLNNNAAKADSLYKIIVFQNSYIRLNKIAELRRILIKENKLKDYLLLDDYNRFIILKSILRKNYTDAAFLSFIELSELLKLSYSSCSETLKSIFVNARLNEISDFTYIKLANYCYENLDFNFALKTVERGIQNSKAPCYQYQLEGILKKILWNMNLH